MPIPKKIVNFLDKAKVKYEIIEHRTVYTGFDKAATLKVPQKMVGKTLAVKLDPEGKPPHTIAFDKLRGRSASYGAGKNFALVLIAANKNLDKEKLRKKVKAKKVDFVKEVWMKKNLKGGVKIGAIPPFGHLWKVSTFVDKSLLKELKIIIAGGNYNWSIKIKSSDFKKLIPDLIIGNFCRARK